jgi:hypothetical protein
MVYFWKVEFLRNTWNQYIPALTPAAALFKVYVIRSLLLLDFSGHITIYL